MLSVAEYRAAMTKRRVARCYAESDTGDEVVVRATYLQGRGCFFDVAFTSHEVSRHQDPA